MVMKLILLLVIYEFFPLYLAHKHNQGHCRSGTNCRLPNCLCMSEETPAGLNKSNIPQIVLFTFEGALDERAYDLYQSLFLTSRHNPNGCPWRITLFLQDNTTDYELAADLHQSGLAELAVGGISNHPLEFWQNATKEEVLAEIYGQKMNIHKKAHVPLEDICGFRSPFLQPSEAVYSALANTMNGFEYDSSLVIRKQKLIDNVPWPFTLDFGWDKPCIIAPCPAIPIMGLWEFPVMSMIGPGGVDRVFHSDFVPIKERGAFLYLVQNFKFYYRRNRTPYMVNLSPEWLYREEGYNATLRFLNRLAKFEDVYLVSIHDAMEWMRQPRDTSDSTNFTAWKCADTEIPRAPLPPGSRQPNSTTEKDDSVCLNVNGKYICRSKKPKPRRTTPMPPPAPPQPGTRKPESTTVSSTEKDDSVCLNVNGKYVCRSKKPKPRRTTPMLPPAPPQPGTRKPESTTVSSTEKDDLVCLNVNGKYVCRSKKPKPRRTTPMPPLALPQPGTSKPEPTTVTTSAPLDNKTMCTTGLIQVPPGSSPVNVSHSSSNIASVSFLCYILAAVLVLG